MELVLELHLIGLPVPSGGWCPACQVPSLAEQAWVAADSETLRVVMRGVAAFCVDCGANAICA